MVKSSFNNLNIELIKNFFNQNLSKYHTVNESSHGPYWEVKFTDQLKEIEVKISGDIGFSIEIFIDNTKYELWQYDRSVNNAMKTTDKNIVYQLNVLKNFLCDNV